MPKTSNPEPQYVAGIVLVQNGVNVELRYQNIDGSLHPNVFLNFQDGPNGITTHRGFAPDGGPFEVDPLDHNVKVY